MKAYLHIFVAAAVGATAMPAIARESSDDLFVRVNNVIGEWASEQHPGRLPVYPSQLGGGAGGGNTGSNATAIQVSQ